MCACCFCANPSTERLAADVLMWTSLFASIFFPKDPTTLAMLSTVATGAVAPSDEASRRVGVTVMESSEAAVRTVTKHKQLPKYREAARRIIETPATGTKDSVDNQYHWTSTCTTALMLAYIEYIQRGWKPSWIDIAEKVRERLPEGTPAPTHEQCRLKIKTQKSRYDRLVVLNNLSGKRPRPIDRLLQAAFDSSKGGEITVDVSEFQEIVEADSPKRTRTA